MIKVVITDESNWKMDMIWFQAKYIKKMIFVGEKYIFCGKVQFPHIRV